jgi:hypothetical protein
MPGTDSYEIHVAGTGRVLVAPLGTDLPANGATPWPAGWQDLGATSRDGVTFAGNGASGQAGTWRSVSADRFVCCGYALSLRFALTRLHADTLPFFFRSPRHEHMLGVEFSEGGTVKYRFVIPHGHVAETEHAPARSEAITLGVRFTALGHHDRYDTAPLATWLMHRPSPAPAQRNVRPLYRDPQKATAR